MPEGYEVRPGLPHLFSLLVACAVAAALLLAGRTIALRLERSTLPSAAPELFPQKNQGLVFQRAAARDDKVLLLYGSSELVVPVPNKAGRFFRNSPTGFQVSPVGKAGTTSMTILQKIGALGDDLRGKKVAISLSPEWFVMPFTRRDWYEGNFSLHAASEIAFGSTFDFKLKRDLALRMLAFPDTLAKSPVLDFATRRLAAGDWFDRACFGVVWPLGKLQNAVLDLQDHLAALTYIIWQRPSSPAQRPQQLDWAKLITEASERALAATKTNKESALDKPVAAGRRDSWFIGRMNAAPEWTDFELLLRVLTRIHARALLVNMPLRGLYYERQGISLSARQLYYNRVRDIAQKYGVALIDFPEHDTDAAFLDSRGTHFTEKGWAFCNRILDDFFHDRPPRG